MARRKTASATGTAIVPVTARPFVINADQAYDPNNPHSWLPLIGDEPGTHGLRVMWGALRARYREHDNSASAYLGGDQRSDLVVELLHQPLVPRAELSPADRG